MNEEGNDFEIPIASTHRLLTMSPGFWRADGIDRYRKALAARSLNFERRCRYPVLPAPSPFNRKTCSLATKGFPPTLARMSGGRL